MPEQNIIRQVDLLFDSDELASVTDSIATRWLSEGPKAAQFREHIKKMSGTKYANFAPNGTLGLYLALLALDLKPGSKIIIPSFTFYGSATAAVFAGLKPVFVDVDPATFSLTADLIDDAVTSNTSAVMPVHIYGQVCDMPSIMSLARKRGLRVIEDAAQAFSVTFKGKTAGSFGDVAFFFRQAHNDRRRWRSCNYGR